MTHYFQYIVKELIASADKKVRPQATNRYADSRLSWVWHVEVLKSQVPCIDGAAVVAPLDVDIQFILLGDKRAPFSDSMATCIFESFSPV